MKQTLLTIFIWTIVFSCTSNQTTEKEHLTERYIEQESPFTDLFYYRIKDNQWIRQPDNIMTVHETFKKGFYEMYLTPEILDQKPFVNGDLYYNVTLRTKIDSLVETYSDYQSASKFYREFWMRRKKEKNDSTVFLVLTEVQQIINGDSVEVRKEMVNQEFRTMIEIVTDWQNGLDNRIALSHFDFLQKEKMHQSAYNLLYENFFYSDLDLKKDSLKKTLTTEKVSLDTIEQRDVFITDNTK